MSLLRVEHLDVRFGGVQAVKNFDLDVVDGEIHGLIGPNGAGKTTVFNTITRLYEPAAGSIRFLGREISALKAHQVAVAGIARTFQNIELFHGLTVLDNVLAGRHRHYTYGLLTSGLALRRVRAEERQAQEEARQLLSFVQLEPLASELAGRLSFGQQRVLELARALATRPRLLLLDEPAAGMNMRETSDLNNLLRRLRKEFEVAILLVEHDMRVIMRICERISVMHYGEKIFEGTPEEVRRDPRVITAYLGTRARHAAD
jgi:branched-chain amino acid transport system ATP-binding protein